MSCRAYLLGITLCALVAVTAIANHARAVEAATPAATASPTATATPLAAPATAVATPDVTLRVDDAGVVTWAIVPGAASYHLTGTLEAIIVNAARGICAPPANPGRRTIALDERFGAGGTRFAAAFPAVAPPDRWLVRGDFIQLEALGIDGASLASQGVGFVEECFKPPAAVGLPGTGGGASDARANLKPVYSLAELATVMGICVLSAGACAPAGRRSSAGLRAARRRS